MRETASIVVLCEVAAEVAGGGTLDDLRARLAQLRVTENPPGIEEAEAAALALERTVGAPPQVASPDYLDAVGAATRALEEALGELGSPFGAAMRAAAGAVDEFVREVETVLPPPAAVARWEASTARRRRRRPVERPVGAADASAGTRRLARVDALPVVDGEPARVTRGRRRGGARPPRRPAARRTSRAPRCRRRRGDASRARARRPVGEVVELLAAGRALVSSRSGRRARRRPRARGSRGRCRSSRTRRRRSSATSRKAAASARTCFQPAASQHRISIVRPVMSRDRGRVRGWTWLIDVARGDRAGVAATPREATESRAKARSPASAACASVAAIAGPTSKSFRRRSDAGGARSAPIGARPAHEALDARSRGDGACIDRARERPRAAARGPHARRPAVRARSRRASSRRPHPRQLVGREAATSRCRAGAAAGDDETWRRGRRRPSRC